jgi:hypothetical protein
MTNEQSKSSSVDYAMEDDLKNRMERALVAITLSTATLVLSIGLLVFQHGAGASAIILLR